MILDYICKTFLSLSLFLVKYSVLRERERELHNVQFLRQIASPLQKLHDPYTNVYHTYIHSLAQGNTISQLSIEILNILYDRHGPKTGFWCLMSFLMSGSGKKSGYS